MKQIVTKGIVLSRTNYGEADRIVTLLTPDYGKLRVMAKGVRRSKSKLAGGIELFSTSDITFIKGRGDVDTLISTRLQRHYGGIVKDIDRTMLGYDLIKQLNKATEDEPEAEYFDLLEQAFAALEDPTVSLEVIRSWFSAQLLKIAGHSPNLQTDTSGNKLDAEQLYHFSFDDMAFVSGNNGRFSAQHIKVLRLLFSSNPPQAIGKVQGIDKLLEQLASLVRTMSSSHIRI
jgi:DNA repair protein RecO (recombination protein O)